MRKRKSEVSMRKMKISVKRRLKLIDLVVNHNYSVVRASRKLELKPYTARSIVNKYRKQGLVYDHSLRKFIVPDNFSMKIEEQSQQFVKEENREQGYIKQQDEKSCSAEVKQQVCAAIREESEVPQAKKEEPNSVFLFYFG